MIEWNTDQKNALEELKIYINDRDSDKDYYCITAAAGCLVGNTKIRLANGAVHSIRYIYKNKNSYIGKYVHSYDIVQDKSTYGKILDIQCTGRKKIMRLIFSDNTKVECTYDHRFLTANNTYIQAKDIHYNIRLIGSFKKHLNESNNFENLEKTNNDNLLAYVKRNHIKYNIYKDFFNCKNITINNSHLDLKAINESLYDYCCDNLSVANPYKYNTLEFKSLDEVIYWIELVNKFDTNIAYNPTQPIEQSIDNIQYLQVKKIEYLNKYEYVYDLLVDQYHNYGIVQKDGDLIFTHNTGKTFLLTEYLKSTNLKYLFLCFTGKAANVSARRGIPSETIHHCLYLPTDLSSWQKFSDKINYGIKDCNGVVEKNPEWNEKDPNTEYRLSYTGDRDVIYYIRKDKDGNDVEETVSNEADIPDDYEPMFRHEVDVPQTIVGKKEIFKEWNSNDKNDMKDFLDLQNIIGFENLVDEADGGNWLFKLRVDRLYKVDVLVIDEYGMVPYDMMRQIIDTCREMHIKLVLSGDPYQLSSLSSRPYPIIPTATLTQVMRQSSDNPILQFATLIRLYGVKTAIEQMFTYQSDKFAIIDENDVTDEFLQQYKSMNTQIICGTNRTRKWLNKRVKGGDAHLEIGDKIILTELNDWDYNIDKSQYLTNGTQGIVLDMQLPEEHFYPEYRPIIDSVGEMDFDNPTLVEKPNSYDKAHDYRLSNYICKVDFESTDGDHFKDNRKLKTLPIALCRTIDDHNFDEWQYLPRNSYYGVNSKGQPKKVKSKDKLTYQYDAIVEHFEGTNREYNKEPKHIKDKETKLYRKCYDDYYSCPDYRKKKRVQRLDGDEERVIYNTERTRPYYLTGHIAELGYALTVHKSQGSEYDDVLVWFEPFGTDKDIREQIYTAVTRAKETLVLVLTKSVKDRLGLYLNKDD